MTINFFEPGDIPQPKEKVKFTLLNADVYPDRWRIKVNVNLTPFQVRPNVAIVLVRDLPDDEPPQVVADMTIIETMHKNMEFTMHIRYVDDPQGVYWLKARLYYEQGVKEPYDESEVKIIIPSAEEMPPLEEGDYPPYPMG